MNATDAARLANVIGSHSPASARRALRGRERRHGGCPAERAVLAGLTARALGNDVIEAITEALALAA